MLTASGKASLLQLSLILSAPPIKQIHGVLKTLCEDLLHPTSGNAGISLPADGAEQQDGANPLSDVGERLPASCKLVSHTLIIIFSGWHQGEIMRL